MGQLDELWVNNRKSIENKNIKQVLIWIEDLSKEEKKEELRHFFHILPLSQIEKYVSECIENKFEENGFVFQDLVNELGLRLDLSVTFGRYQGKKGENGFDGLWRSNDGHAFVIESKITDNFGVKLDSVIKYRKDLIQKGKIEENNSSILIVVGRQDTKMLSTMIKGCEYSRIIRHIGIESLIRLVKESKNNTAQTNQIYEILKPRDNVNLDELVNLFFLNDNEKINQKKMLERSIISLNDSKEKTNKITRTKAINFYDKCVEEVEKSYKIRLQKREGNSKILYENKEQDLGMLITNSRETKKKGYDQYWFAYYSHFKSNVLTYKNKYIMYGCGSEKNILIIPIDVMEKYKESLMKTVRNKGTHWHVVIIHKNNKFYLKTPLGKEKEIDISAYKLNNISY